MSLQTRPLLTIEAEVADPVTIGDGGGGLRRYVPITGGRVSGEVSGRVLPGVDWQSVLADGTIELVAHYALQSDAGDHIEVTSEGVRAGPPEVLERLARGEAVDPSLYYFRTAMRFRTGAAAHKRLNTLLAIGVGARSAGRVVITAYEIL